jgi:carbamoyl-phosphate synthase small subunit
VAIPQSAVLVLEDGSRFSGRAYGALGTTLGEAVFATGMTGYQETLTDPSYAGQIVVMTAPHIGITGVKRRKTTSPKRFWVSGFVVRDPARMVSNYRSRPAPSMPASIDESIVGISGIDTRAVVPQAPGCRRAMRAGIFSGPDAERLPLDSQLDSVRSSAQMTGAEPVSQRVSTREAIPRARRRATGSEPSPSSTSV